MTEDDLWRFGLASVSLSHALSLPLVADDRVLQALSLAGEPSSAAYGSDAIITALAVNNAIDATQAASLKLELMKWRYRFILPDAKDLKSLADQFSHSLPGRPLRLVARYAHDCMCDVGLFAGLEATEPPSTIADRVHQHWAYAIAELLVLVWQDERKYSVDQASGLTAWALTEFLPGLPVNLLARAPRLADVLPFMLLGRFMTYLAPSTNFERCRAGLAAVASGLSLSPAEARKAELEVIDAL